MKGLSNFHCLKRINRSTPLIFFKILCFFRLIMIFRIVEHGRAHTIFSFLTHQNIIVHTAFTACPESFILCKLGISNRFIAQIAIDLHYSKAGSKPKIFDFGIFFPGKIENLLLDRFCNTAFSECRRNDQAAVGNIFSMAPGFDITKSNPLIYLR